MADLQNYDSATVGIALERGRLTMSPIQWLGHLDHPDEIPNGRGTAIALLQNESHRDRRSTKVYVRHGLGARGYAKCSLGEKAISVGQQIDLLLLVTGQYGEFC